MNRNSLFGLLGITLLTFLGAFMLGRWTRSARIQRAPAVAGVVAGAALAAERSSSGNSASEATRRLAAMRTEAYQEQAPGEGSAPSTPLPSKKLIVGTKFRLKEKAKVSLPSAASSPQVALARSTDTAKLPATAPARAADTAVDAASATESSIAKSRIAKDIVAIEERQHYAAQLPKDLLRKGLEAKVDVVGELADVIIMSSPAFDAQSKDTVIKQVCLDLKTLGFKRVHITDGRDYTMHFGL